MLHTRTHTCDNKVQTYQLQTVQLKLHIAWGDHLLWFVSLGQVKAEPDSCSAYNPYGHFWGLFYNQREYVNLHYSGQHSLWSEYSLFALLTLRLWDYGPTAKCYSISWELYHIYKYNVYNGYHSVLLTIYKATIVPQHYP